MPFFYKHDHFLENHNKVGSVGVFLFVCCTTGDDDNIVQQKKPHFFLFPL